MSVAKRMAAWADARPSVESLLPVTWPPGAERIDVMTYHCGTCSTAVSDENYRGETVRLESGDVLVKAVAYCTDCNLLHWSVSRLTTIGGLGIHDVVAEWPNPFAGR